MASYATLAELAAYLDIEVAELPSDATRQLQRASELIDYVTLNRIDTDNDDDMEAARMAVSAQIEMWIQEGETGDVAGEGAIKSKTVGKVSVTYADAGGSTPPANVDTRLAARARQALFLAGLLYRGASR